MNRLADKATRSVLTLATAALSLLAVAAPAVAAANKPTLMLSHVDGSRFPTAVVYATVLSDKGYPISGLTESNFVVTENGVPARNFTIASAVDVEEPLAAMLTLDVSGSMDASALRAEKAAATRFVDRLRPQDQAGVIAFSTDVRPILDFTDDRAALTDAVNGLAAGGNTALYDALYASVDAASQAEPLRRIVVFMTDGRNTQRGASLDDGLNLAAQHGIPVYTIGLGADLDRGVLTRIAERTGGTSLFAPTPQALEASYQAISDQLRGQYVITYDSPAPKGARVYRTTIAANVSGENLKAERPYEANPMAPSIEGLTLRDGQRIEGVVDVAMEVASTLPVTAARLLVNGREIERLTSAPFAFSLDTSRLSTGRQEIVLSATDAAGSETSKRVQVVVPPALVDRSSAAVEPAASTLPPSTVPSVTLPSVDIGNPLDRLASALPQLEAPRITLPVIEAPQITLPVIEAPQITLPVIEAPQITLPVIEAPQFTLPVIEAPQITLPIIEPSGWPGAAGIAAVVQFGQQAVDTVGKAPMLVEGLSQGASETGNRAMRQAQAEAPRLGILGIVLLGSVLMFFAARKGLIAARKNLRRITCDQCGTIYQAFEQMCPQCHEQEMAQVEERSLGEFLVQNNLLTAEGLDKVLLKSRELGQSLELTTIQEGLVSARELSQARFYLAHSAEMHDRLSDAAHKNHAGSHSGLRRLLPAASVPMSIAVVAMTTIGTAIPNVF